jgi:methylthioribulose-1-phosphate dehydratase
MSMIEIQETFGEESKKLVSLIRSLNGSGHNPATSGNYSLRLNSTSKVCLVSETGVDKSQFAEMNLLPLSLEVGQVLSGFEGRRSSAETALHLAIYRLTNASCVLHSHLLDSLLFADLFPGTPFIEVGGLELLKGFRGVKTHETNISIPCFENTQDMEQLARDLVGKLDGQKGACGFIVRHHGLYVWGEGVDEAKRHLEVFEYLFRYYLLSKRRSS